MVKTSGIARFWILLLSALAMIASGRFATAQQVSREQDIVNLRLGQRIKVDDGTCPPGQVKEISGSKMAATGIVRTAKCVPRLGAKTSPTK
jgi:hypothetical protein